MDAAYTGNDRNYGKSYNKCGSGIGGLCGGGTVFYPPSVRAKEAGGPAFCGCVYFTAESVVHCPVSGLYEKRNES